MPINYKTVQDYAEAEYEISKSRFLTFVQRAGSESEALTFIQQIKKLHWEASHNCSAYSIGEYATLQKADDDGEPSGTAGKPLLEVLKKTGINDVVIVVTRYFGGIKLGAGGLIRAYGKAASLGLAAAKIVEKVRHRRLAIDFTYTLLGTLENNLRLRGYQIEAKEFTEQVRLLVLVPKDEQDQFVEEITEWTSSQAKITVLDEIYIEIPIVE